MKKHIIINVGRQLGSGGRIIGNRIAEDFNIKFYDKEQRLSQSIVQLFCSHLRQ